MEEKKQWFRREFQNNDMDYLREWLNRHNFTPSDFFVVTEEYGTISLFYFATNSID